MSLVASTCVFVFIGRKAYTDIDCNNWISAGKLCLQLTSSWTCYEENDRTSGQFGWAHSTLLDLTTTSAMMNVAIPWNALPCFFCFLLLLHHQSGLCKPEASLWGKTLVVLGFRAEIIVNDHVIAITHSDSCKGIVATIFSLPIEWEFDLARHYSMLLGHSPPSPSFSACKSSLWPRFPIIESKLTLLILSFFRIAIWNRNIVVSLIVAIVWLGGVALNIRRTSASWSPVVEPSTYGLCPASACKDLTLVRSFTGALILESTNWRLCKLCKAITGLSPMASAFSWSM